MRPLFALRWRGCSGAAVVVRADVGDAVAGAAIGAVVGADVIGAAAGMGFRRLHTINP